jgi:hypothetical protein
LPKYFFGTLEWRSGDKENVLAYFEQRADKIDFILAGERMDEYAFLQLIEPQLIELLAKIISGSFFVMGNIEHYESPRAIPLFRFSYRNLLELVSQCDLFPAPREHDADSAIGSFVPCDEIARLEPPQIALEIIMTEQFLPQVMMQQPARELWSNQR